MKIEITDKLVQDAQLYLRDALEQMEEDVADWVMDSALLPHPATDEETDKWNEAVQAAASEVLKRVLGAELHKLNCVSK